MPVNLSIKGVPDALAQRLRKRAERNHRSMQGELMALVERAAAEVEPSVVAGSGARHGSKTIEQIAAESRLRFPQPIEGGPLAVDIIRADRDAR